MGRYLAVAAVLVAGAAVFVAGAHGNQGPFGLLVVAAYALTGWTAYLTGLTLPSRLDAAAVAGAAALAGGPQVAHAPATASQHVAGFVVFLVLPLLVGRYLAQHRRLVRTLDAHNRQLRTERTLLAEREQLRERLRIARDVHDSLGRRLSLVAVRAAALEVTGLPPAQRDAVQALAASARDAVAELYQLVGSLRGAADDTPGADRIPALVAEFRGAGVAATLDGECGPLPLAASRAAYRVVEEGLANAAKHAPGRPVAIQMTREADAVVLTVTNPLAEPTDHGDGHQGRARGGDPASGGGPGDGQAASDGGAVGAGHTVPGGGSGRAHRASGGWAAGTGHAAPDDGVGRAHRARDGGPAGAGHPAPDDGSGLGGHSSSGRGSGRAGRLPPGGEPGRGECAAPGGGSSLGGHPSPGCESGIGGSGLGAELSPGCGAGLGGPAGSGGFGLAGLAERVGAAGGFLDHRVERGWFRLVAMVPTAAVEVVPPVRRSRHAALLGVATGALLFVLLPASLLTGVG
jgi:signal transduction histidine kinase